MLDKALLRPGRFDRRIIVDKPDLKGRLETLKVHSKDVMMDETVDLDALALATAGLVGSDLANMINEAAINAVKNGRKFVNQSDLFDAFELVAVGGKEKKDRIMSDKELQDRYFTRSRSCDGNSIAEKYRAGTEDHDRATYHGCTWIYLTDSGRRKIFTDQR